VREEFQEMVEALQAHTASIQLQVDAQEWMGHQVEHLVQAMDLQWDAQEVLASALLATEQPHWGSARAGGGMGDSE